ncbi:18838_t:CDS:1, partial [Gigaspora margarita]
IMYIFKINYSTCGNYVTSNTITGIAQLIKLLDWIGINIGIIPVQLF